jgi:predicted HTH domain antitoxin
MTTETVSFEISQDILASLKVGAAELERNMRLLAAIDYFQEKKLSLGKAAQLAGMNRLAFMDALAEKGVVMFDYDESMLASELSGVAQLGLGASGQACIIAFRVHVDIIRPFPAYPAGVARPPGYHERPARGIVFRHRIRPALRSTALLLAC